MLFKIRAAIANCCCGKPLRCTQRSKEGKTLHGRGESHHLSESLESGNSKNSLSPEQTQPHSFPPSPENWKSDICVTKLSSRNSFRGEYEWWKLYNADFPNPPYILTPGFVCVRVCVCCVSHNYAISQFTIEQILSVLQLSNRHQLMTVTTRLDFPANLPTRNNVTSRIMAKGSAKVSSRKRGHRWHDFLAMYGIGTPS